MPFIHEDFLLSNHTARHLYHTYAEREPILDYHCHLPPGDIARNRQFQDLTEIWLEGDHYKWRAMRANGVDERYCTGNATPFEKFQAWAKTVPATLRNPLYHWTHLELKRYFGIDELLDESTAASIWERANTLLATEEMRTHGILARFRVNTVCTTDDPADDLADHRALRDSKCPARVLPAYRPDKALTVHRPDIFNEWVDRLAQAANREISTLQNLEDALKSRHDFFHSLGCRLSDHGLDRCYSAAPTDATATRIFKRARQGHAATRKEHEQFASHLMLFFGRLDAAKGWTKQLHLGALRAVNTRALREIGADSGFDSIGDTPQLASLAAYLNVLEQENALPRTIIYNLNPADNYALATMAGNFPAKVQFGSAWWFLDQKEGIELQLNALSNTGLLSRFIGMLTDSRSFLSYPRHEYFRRVLCNLIGRDVENGELPDSEDLLGPMVRDICYANARRYLGLDAG